MDDLWCKVVAVEWVEVISANSVWTWPLSVSHIYADKLWISNSSVEERLRRKIEKKNETNLDATVSGGNSEEVEWRIESCQNVSDVRWSHTRTNSWSLQRGTKRERVPVRSKRGKQNKFCVGSDRVSVKLIHNPCPVGFMSYGPPQTPKFIILANSGK